MEIAVMFLVYNIAVLVSQKSKIRKFKNRKKASIIYYIRGEFILDVYIQCY